MGSADDLKLHFNFVEKAEALFEECVLRACLRGESPLTLKQYKKRETKLKKLRRLARKAA